MCADSTHFASLNHWITVSNLFPPQLHWDHRRVSAPYIQPKTWIQLVNSFVLILLTVYT